MAIEIGKTSPDFELEASNGERVKLSDYRGKKCCSVFLPERHDTWLHNAGM